MICCLLRFFCNYKKMSISDIQNRMKTERRMKRNSAIYPL